MNRLIIVGNGFDLSLGLKTSYKDFLFNYLNDCVSRLVKRTDVKDISGKSYYILDDGLVSLKIPIEVVQRGVINKIKEFATYFELSNFLKSKKYLTFSFELLEEIDKNSFIKGWIDIEVLYYDTLITKLEIKDKQSREKQLYEYNQKFDFLKTNLITYLKKIQFNYYQNDNFINFMVNYVDKLSQPYIENDRNEEIDQYMFLNFNYTPFLSKSLNLMNHDYSKVNYIHGQLSDEDSIIFGFGDEHDRYYQTIESERSKELFKNIKSPHYFKKPNYKRLKSFIESDFFDVYIVGHSCGISDRTLFNEIFEYKNQNGIEMCLSIKILHYKMEDGKDDFFEKSIEIMRHFKDKKVMRNMIQTFNEHDQIPQFKLP